jgi:hypothetical protein
MISLAGSARSPFMPTIAEVGGELEQFCGFGDVLHALNGADSYVELLYDFARDYFTAAGVNWIWSVIRESPTWCWYFEPVGLGATRAAE